MDFPVNVPTFTHVYTLSSLLLLQDKGKQRERERSVSPITETKERCFSSSLRLASLYVARQPEKREKNDCTHRKERRNKAGRVEN
jgi:hypothetical protein